MKLMTSRYIGERRVYDIEVENYHNFYANRINVHNCTGLPVPTIAVATNVGVSVIKDDGTVVDTDQTYAWNNVSFSDNGWLYQQYDGNNSGGTLYVVKNYTADNADINSHPSAYSYSSSSTPALNYTPSTPSDAIDSGIYCQGVYYYPAQEGLTHLKENTTTPANGMVAYTTSQYCSGYMHGAIKCNFNGDDDSLSDKSVNATSFTPSGTITYTAVATNAEKKYWESTSAETITIGSVTTGYLTWWENVSGVATHYAAIIAAGASTTEGYINGVYSAASIPQTNVTVTGNTSLNYKVAAVEVADVRVTATTITADDIKFIYSQEKPLFQANAKCTLADNDSVSTMSWNEYKQLLYVDDGVKVSKFSGLKRVGEFTSGIAGKIASESIIEVIG